jgi:hypothetical protein
MACTFYNLQYCHRQHNSIFTPETKPFHSLQREKIQGPRRLTSDNNFEAAAYKRKLKQKTTKKAKVVPVAVIQSQQ